MKVLAIIAAVVLTTSSAMALETVMGLKGRFDYVRTETDSNPGKSASGILTTSFLRLVTDAKLNETTSAKLTLDFQPTTTPDNNVQKLVDEAFLTKEFSYGIKAMAGKQAIMTGGRENDYSTRDLYITSEFKKVTPDNLMGLSLGYSMEGQNVFLQYLEQTDTLSGTFSDKKVLGAAYYGSFLENMIMPIVSYHKMGTTRLGAYDNAMSVGLRVVPLKVLMVEADWLSLEQEKNGTVTGATAADAKLTSLVGHVRYLHENFQPFAKFISEKGKKGYTGLAAGSTESKRTAWELGLEYMPSKDEDFRYHVVYNSSETKRESLAPTSKVEEKKIYAGIAFNYNILK